MFNLIDSDKNTIQQLKYTIISVYDILHGILILKPAYKFKTLFVCLFLRFLSHSIDWLDSVSRPNDKFSAIWQRILLIKSEWSVLKFWWIQGGPNEPFLHRNPVKRSFACQGRCYPWHGAQFIIRRTLSNLRIVNSFGDVTITGEGLQSFNYTRH